MAGFNFADSYRAAGLNPGPDILRLRQEPFDRLREDISASLAVDLTRLYFGLSVPRGTEWFRAIFGEADPSFSLIDNQREAAVLAAGLLSAAIEDGKTYAALALLTTSAAGLRRPAVRPELLDEARHAISVEAIATRKRNPSNPDQIKAPTKSKLPTDAATLAQSGDWGKTAALFKQVSDEAYEATKVLANQTASVIRPLAADVADLAEEVEMLWWHIGGWSRFLEKPFAELKPALAAVMAGLDLADLSRTLAGPAAAPAILQRTITIGRKGKVLKLTIKDAVDALSSEALESLPLDEALGSVPDICPVLTAFAKASEIGAGIGWHGAYTKTTGLEPSASFQPLDLALQVYRERQLLAAL